MNYLSSHQAAVAALALMAEEHSSIAGSTFEEKLQFAEIYRFFTQLKGWHTQEVRSCQGANVRA